MSRVLVLLVLLSSAAPAQQNEPAPIDAPYNKVFDPWRACLGAQELARRGAPDALRTCFLAAYVRLSQPFLGGEDLLTMHRVFEDVLTSVGDKKFAGALAKQRPEVRSAAGRFLGGFGKLKQYPRTLKLVRESPKIDWPLDEAGRNDE